MSRRFFFFQGFILMLFLSCGPASKNKIPVVVYIDAFEDATLSKARQGFADALDAAGYSEKKGSLELVYRNAQGDQPALGLAVNYALGRNADLIATCPTVATIAAIQKTRSVPVFMIVSPTPALMKVNDTNGAAPKNLFGTAEDLAYIDTSLALIPTLVHPKGLKLVVGMIYNQAEPQSVDALRRIKELALKLDMAIEALPVTNSSEALLVTKALLRKNVDVFFANPDNVVFASFDTVVKSCSENNVPVFTSEAGLVERGAVAAFGADIYQWGYQTGVQAAAYLKSGAAGNIEMVKTRKRLYNPVAAKKFGIVLPPGFEPIAK